MLASSVLAQEFVKVDENENAVFYVDKVSIKKEKDVFKFSGKAETKAYISVTDFATDCKAYITLLEVFTTQDLVITRRQRNPQVIPLEKGTPVETAVNYVCYGTLKKSPLRGTIPQAE